MASGIRVVGIGGAIRPGSTSETALCWVMREMASRGFATTTFLGADLDFSLYDPTGENNPADPRLVAYVEAVRACDAFVIASPVYHGGATGLLKNALDHLQPLMGDARPYLTHRPVLCLAAGGGHAGALSTLSGLRDVVHALRGWPTPMQVPINSSTRPFDEAGGCIDPKLEKVMLAGIGDLHHFAVMSHRVKPQAAGQA